MTDTKQSKQDKVRSNNSCLCRTRNILILIIVLIAWEAFSYSKKSESMQDSIVILNPQIIFDERMSEGDSPSEARMYFETLIAVYTKNNYIVLSSDNLLGYPLELKPSLPTKASLVATAKKLQIDVSQERFEEIEKQLDDSVQSMIDKLHNK